ncbi:MAG: hypothetical protein HYV26_06610 [Candidatus Hydrogenedentes bacterium]|nr:hypothetical protein [Candidatus Hydrogenedentota bacterium]
MLDSGLDCVLAVVADSVEPAVRVVFQTPSGRQEWSIGHLGSGERSQIRTSVFALEQVRRWLTGVKGRV